MAEIQIERRPRSNGAAWALGVLLVLILLGAGWYFGMGPGTAVLDRDDAVEPVPSAPQTAPDGMAPPPARP